MKKTEIEKLFIYENDSLTTALTRLSESCGVPLIVTDDARRLIGILSDGDIRRFLVKEQTMKACVKEVANYRPKAIKASQRFEAKKLLAEYQITMLPIVDENGTIVDVVLKDSVSVSTRGRFSVPVVIMAGGGGRGGGGTLGVDRRTGE